MPRHLEVLASCNWHRWHPEEQDGTKSDSAAEFKCAPKPCADVSSSISTRCRIKSINHWKDRNLDRIRKQ